MISRVAWRVVLAVACLLPAAFVRAQGQTVNGSDDDAPASGSPTLKVGDLPPRIAVQKWVQGDPVTRFEAGKVYIVEFWATWCGPCKQQIPHLDQIAREHPEVVVIGMASSERGAGGDNESSPQIRSVEQFVTQQGDKMSYRVGVETSKETYKSWMGAAGRGGIPSAFLVGADGKIAWIGHPASIDAPLAKAVAAKEVDRGSTAVKGKGVDKGLGKEGAKGKKYPVQIGSPAPRINITKWVKGDPVRTFEKGKAYAVEFWATWCKPCRDSIQEMTELQKVSPDRLIVMAVAGAEENEEGATLDERLPNLQKFVKEQGDKMEYRVAYDRDGAMHKAWMNATGKDRIPSLFLVDGEGKLVWFGHPGELTEEILEKVLPVEAADGSKGERQVEKKSPAKAIPGKK
jgi:thiol-disulfide isomerase/thioredoxin